LAGPKHRKMEMRFGTRNVRSLHRTGAQNRVEMELSKCKLDLVAVQEVRWQKSSNELLEDYALFYGEGNGNHQLGTGFFCT
jgi:exonuclease III